MLPPVSLEAMCILCIIVTGRDTWVPSGLCFGSAGVQTVTSAHLRTPETKREKFLYQYCSITNPSQRFLGNKQYFQPSLTPGSHLPFFALFHSTAMQASPKFMELSQAPSEIRRRDLGRLFP